MLEKAHECKIIIMKSQYTYRIVMPLTFTFALRLLFVILVEFILFMASWTAASLRFRTLYQFHSFILFIFFSGHLKKHSPFATSSWSILFSFLQPFIFLEAVYLHFSNLGYVLRLALWYLFTPFLFCTWRDYLPLSQAAIRWQFNFKRKKKNLRSLVNVKLNGNSIPFNTIINFPSKLKTNISYSERNTFLEKSQFSFVS